MRPLTRSLSYALLAIVFAATPVLAAENITLAWDANTESDLAGYIVEYGTSAAPFTSRVDVGYQTTWTLTGTASATTYIFHVLAYNTEGIESAPSNDVTWTTGGCLTPDPFTAMGGGTCYNGGWLPPGMTPPTSTPPPPPPPPSSSGSSTNCPGYPNPAFPGATCVNGGWVPGGSTGSSTPPPSAPPPTTPPPSTPPPSGPTTCPGYPNPAFPGAVCVNGGWVPGGSTGGSTPPPSTPPPTTPPPSTPPPSGPTTCPGYPNPAFPGAVCVNGGWVPGGSTGGSTPPPSTPPPTTPPPPSTPPPSGPTTCPGYPNPAFPGAVCVNGGWVPGGSTGGSTPPPPPPPPPPTTQGGCATPNPFANAPGLIGACYNGGWYSVQAQTGTVQSINGSWVIVGDNGTTYLPLAALPVSLLQSGLAVVFAGVPVATQNGMTLMSVATIGAR